MTSSRKLSLGALLVPGLGLFFALLFAAQNVFRSHVLGHPMAWRGVLEESVPRWLLYSALAPAVGWFAARYPVERARLQTRLPLHLFAAVAFAMVHASLMGVVFDVFQLYPRGETLHGAIGRLAMVYFAINFVMYGAISGACHALRYQRQVRDRELLAADLRASLSQARLEALRAQLDPHFLFNTLNATSSLALAGEREQVVRTLSSLSDLLRVSLDRGLPHLIPLRRELSILSGYLDIQRIRFADRLGIDLEIEAPAEAALVPSMMLQPLVENALQHGIAVRPGPGRVTLRAARAGGTLRLRVEDTGPGFAPAAAAGEVQGIGLSNTRSRLEQLFGREQALESGNLPGGGAFVEVRMPFRTAPEEP